MADKSDAPAYLYIATYDDPDAAQGDWDALKELVKGRLITVYGMVLVSRGEDGKIDVKDDAHEVGVGATLGAVGGAVIGLIFPPAFLASALVGGGIGAGLGKILDRHRNKEIKEDVEDVMPPGSSGIVALFEERWVASVDAALKKASKVTKREVDAESAKEVEKEVSEKA
jgi:uncharacterized membrane protein